MTASPLYFDYNATCPLLDSVKEAMFACVSGPLNPSSIHHFGRAARHFMEEARLKILRAIEAHESKGNAGVRVIFTASGTEANNTALQGLKGYHILVSAIEHASILKGKHTEQNLRILPVQKNGMLDLHALEKILADTPSPKLVSVMMVNNETGVIQPIAEIVRIARTHNALVHTDAVQALGKIPVHFHALGVDMMTLSAHKCGGPIGAAALIIRKNIPLQPLIQGGGQELGYRAGTENVMAITGFGAAAEYVTTPSFLQNYAKIAVLRDTMENTILTMAPEAVIFGKESPRVANTSVITMPDIPYETQLMHFDLAGIAVSSGSACSSGKITHSHVLNSMGVPKAMARTAIRISLGPEHTETEIQRFVELWRELYLRTHSSHHSSTPHPSPLSRQVA